MQMEIASSTDLSTVEDLNREYISAVRTSDVERFRELLAEDFRCSLPDGSIIDRPQFLERAARPLDLQTLEIHDVEIRLLGEAAIVHARTTFTTADGRAGSGRYTDVWCRRGGVWQAVAAHFTRQIG